MSEVLLHHYPQSPVSEKVRVALGLKGLEWRSVEIPRLPPKPDLMPLTGGYRLTPVMQVGADVYCDSLCILRELERRFPEPTLFPGNSDGMPWGVSRWTDGLLFHTVISLVFADAADELPPEFFADRGPLYFGDAFDIKALLVSGYDDSALGRHGAFRVGTKLLHKPYSKRDLAGKLETILEGASG